MPLTQRIATGKPTEVIAAKKKNCNLCAPIAWKGSLCTFCPTYKTEHYTEGVGDSPIDFFCVSESPEEPGPSSNAGRHISWNKDAERMVRNAFKIHRKIVPAYHQLRGRYTYAVRCCIPGPKPNKKHTDCCSVLFHEEILSMRREGKPIFILALGAAVLRSLDVKFGKYQDVQGRFLRTEINGNTVYILPTMSTRQLMAKSGYFEVLKQHVQLFLSTVQGASLGYDVKVTIPTEELTKDYIIPGTIKEVRELVEMIIGYTSKGDADSHPIALDTEVNTLYPHRSKTKILTVTAAWNAGRATSIPVEHAETPWTFREIAPYIRALLQCKKPKIFHNGKYDLKVFKSKGFLVNRLAWDTMLGEHLLAEDKRGYYSLKRITTDMLPRYAGYEDELKVLLKSLEKKGEMLKGHGEIVLTGAEKKLAEDVGYEFVPLKLLNPYGAIDADVTWQLCAIQRSRMRAETAMLRKKRKGYSKHGWVGHLANNPCDSDKPLFDIMYHRSIPTTRALADMEYRGMQVDRDHVSDLREKMDISINTMRYGLHQMIPPNLLEKEFNPNSTAQLRRILFQTGYIHPETQKPVDYAGTIPEEDLPRTDTGLVSTNAAFLKLLKGTYNCPFATLLLNYRAMSKARTTFVENIYVMSAEDGKMHTTFHIPGTSTGRLSSSGENMQNIPMFIMEHNIKKTFTASDTDNMVIINADAKAAEVRLYAAYSGDKNLIKALNDGMDPHSFFGSIVYAPETVLKGVPQSQHKTVLQTIGIDDEHAWTYEDFQAMKSFESNDPWYSKQLYKLRHNIKRVVFGILYGAGKKNIANIVGIPVEQAQAIIDVLFRMFPSIPDYIKKTHQQVEYLNTVETFLGRRRRFDYKNMSGYPKAKALRQAVNFKIQSTSSEMVMDVLCNTDGPIKNDFGGNMLITVHDSLVFELPNKYIGQMPDFIYEYGVKRIAEKYPWLPVPFQWDVEVGPSYGEPQSIPGFLTKHPEMTQLEDTEFFDHQEIEDLRNAQSAGFNGI